MHKAVFFFFSVLFVFENILSMLRVRLHTYTFFSRGFIGYI